MNTAGAVTYELDDLEQAAADLARQLCDFPLQKNTVGILFCDSMVDHKELLQALETRFPFQIAGCTSMGTISGSEGFHEACIALTVMTGDDCSFQVVLSDGFTPASAEQTLTDAYRSGAAALEGEPRLIIAYPPYRHDMAMDVYPDILGRASGGVPVFGGLPSHNMEYGENGVLAGGDLHSDRLVMILVGGNVRPVFSVKSLVGDVAAQKRTITRAENNRIYQVGDTSFTDFLRGVGLNVQHYDFEDGTYTYFTNPLLIELPDDGHGGSGASFVRTLHALRPEEGYGEIIGNVPLGATLSIGTMTKQVIRNTALDCIADIKRQMAENQTDGYRYSMILGTSCMVRFMIMAPDGDTECNVLMGELSGEEVFSCFYAYGELCPSSVQGDGADNRAHNQSIVMVAL